MAASAARKIVAVWERDLWAESKGQETERVVANKDKLTLTVLWELLNQAGCCRPGNSSVLIRLHPGYRKKCLFILYFFLNTQQTVCITYWVLALGYFCIKEMRCTMVPGARFSPLKCWSGGPPQSWIGSAREQARPPASGAWCVCACVCTPALLGPGDRGRRECLRKMHVQCCKAFFVMCYSFFLLLLKINTIFSSRRMRVIYDTAFSEVVFLVCGFANSSN